MKIIDLTHILEEDLPVDPPVQIPKIQRQDHKDTAAAMPQYFPGTTVDDLPEGNGWAIDLVSLCTHSGTHLDAPWHYFPRQNEDIIPGGEKAWTIDQVPLEWCIGRGVKLDFSDKPDGYKISTQDVKDYLAKINYTLKPGDIVLLRSGAETRWPTAEYLVAGAGMSGDATHWLCEQGVRVVGTDGWSWDVPLPLEAKEYAKTHDPSIIWEGHRAGRYRAYCHMEKLTNLDQLPDYGYTVYCFPIPVKAASAGWCRCVAILDEE